MHIDITPGNMAKLLLLCACHFSDKIKIFDNSYQYFIKFSTFSFSVIFSISETFSQYSYNKSLSPFYISMIIIINNEFVWYDGAVLFIMIFLYSTFVNTFCWMENMNDIVHKRSKLLPLIYVFKQILYIFLRIISSI